MRRIGFLLLIAATLGSPKPSACQGEMVDINGVYYLYRKAASGDQLWVLSFTPSKRSALTFQSSRNLKKVVTSLGSWGVEKSGQFWVDLKGPSGQTKMTFKAVSKPMRLVATNWNAAVWGKSAPVFMRGTPPTLK